MSADETGVMFPDAFFERPARRADVIASVRAVQNVDEGGQGSCLKGTEQLRRPVAKKNEIESVAHPSRRAPGPLQGGVDLVRW